MANGDYIVAGTASDGSQIRRFADQNVQSSIDKVLATAPPGRTAGIIMYADTKTGEVKAGVFGKKEIAAPGLLGKLFGTKTAVWTYGGTIAYDYKNKDIGAQAQAAIWF